MSVQIVRRHFNVNEYYRMAAAGVLKEDDRVELIEGEIVEMNPIGSRHAACVGRLTKLLERMAGDRSIVWVQNPVQVDEYSEPLPDVALLKPRDDFYAQANPQAADVFLIIEVADSSVEYDRDIKVPLYARASVAEVWLVNLPKETIEIYSQPLEGKYLEIRLVKRGESLSAKSIPYLTIDAHAILG
ncbi:MAG TPA: Uma2 family endonuclease [Pyrinomonadaceae bacterium]|jgi:Uma2 family endonuclease|nr:Uma2 family endonuclease [Pyrinomonadaceae bacterium]